jgi:hypothetical protein
VPSPRASRTTSALLAALAIAASGCGGDARAEEERDQCFHEARLAADYAVVSMAYRSGRLGSAAEIERQIERYAERNETPGFEATPFFDADGRLLPLGRMSDDQLATFQVWMNGEARAELRDELREAERRATARAEERCG